MCSRRYKSVSDLPAHLQGQARAALNTVFSIEQVNVEGDASKARKSQGKATGEAPKRAKHVERTRNGGTWTSARYWQAVRSCLRRAFRYWRPAQEALKAARVPMKGPHGQKWAYLCAKCGKFFKRDEVQIHHVEAVGTLTCVDDLAGFLERLTPEGPESFQVLCVECHKQITGEQRQSAA